MPRIEVLGRVAFSVLALLAGTGSAAAQHLWTVDDSAPADFATIQGAVDAAADGDVVRVFPGSYAGFHVAGKGLAIVRGDPASAWTLTAPVTLSSTVAGQTIVISGSTQSIFPFGPSGAPGITISGCAGAVRIQDCTWRGVNATNYIWPPPFPRPPASRGGSGARIENSSDVMFVATDATGGQGALGSSIYPTNPNGGGHALNLSASSCACWQVSATAGLPATCHTLGGFNGTEGGSGALLVGSFLFASGSLLKGGQGGMHSLTVNQCSASTGSGVCGDGSAGLRLESAASNAFFQQPDIKGGPPGTSNCLSGTWYLDGQYVPRVLVHASGSTLGRVPGPTRELAAPAFVAGTSVVGLTATGAPGDLIYAVAESAAHFQYDPALGGVWSLAYPPQPAPIPDAVIPSGGSVAFQITLPAVPATQDAALHFVQLYVVDFNGRVLVSTPRAVVLAH